MIERFKVIYFQYLELRFDSNIRGLCSLIYAISLILFLPVVIYVPALAFKQSKKKNCILPNVYVVGHKSN